MDLVCYERDQDFVLGRFREGEFDYLEAASEVVETEFFRHLGAQEILRTLAATYPTPRKKAEVPLWVSLASTLALRLHGVHSFHASPYVVRCGGMLHAFGPTVAAKVSHPDTGDVTLRCAGFNAKNPYDRQTPCDQDFLRKLARDTPAAALQTWDQPGRGPGAAGAGGLRPGGPLHRGRLLPLRPGHPRLRGLGPPALR